MDPEDTNFPHGYSHFVPYDWLSYGMLYRGIENRTGKTVTMKKYCRGARGRKHPVPEIREASLLKKLRHPNIVVLNASILDGDFIFMIFEDFPTNLREYITSLAEDQLIDRSQQKSYLYQMLQGLFFCHCNGFSHFDLRPENLILDDKGTLKLANFSLVYADDTPMRDCATNSLWYRSPEQLLHNDCYPNRIDIWSCGCVFAEMATRNPLFAGDSVIDQLWQIFSTIASPAEGRARIRGHIPYSFFPHRPDSTLKSILGDYIDRNGLRMLLKMLDYDPLRRPSSLSLLSNVYFLDLDLSKFPSGSYGLRRSLSSLL